MKTEAEHREVCTDPGCSIDLHPKVGPIFETTVVGLLVEIRDILGSLAEAFGLMARVGQTTDDEPESDDRTAGSWVRRDDGSDSAQG